MANSCNDLIRTCASPLPLSCRAGVFHAWAMPSCNAATIAQSCAARNAHEVCALVVCDRILPLQGRAEHGQHSLCVKCTSWHLAHFTTGSCTCRLHKAGIEVILDVVYNHTAEGSDVNPYILSHRCIDCNSYYQMNLGQYEQMLNYSGCGNTVSANHPATKEQILDSLRHWCEEYHVDGFRFDLATALCRGAPPRPPARRMLFCLSLGIPWRRPLRHCPLPRCAPPPPAHPRRVLYCLSLCIPWPCVLHVGFCRVALAPAFCRGAPSAFAIMRSSFV